MTLALHRSDEFNRDFDLPYRWYREQAGEAASDDAQVAASVPHSSYLDFGPWTLDFRP